MEIVVLPELTQNWINMWKRSIQQDMLFASTEHTWCDLRLCDKDVRKKLSNKSVTLLTCLLNDPIFFCAPSSARTGLLVCIGENISSLADDVFSERAKRKARIQVERKVVRPQYCVVCGHEGRIEAHHTDYDQPLLVTWLCVACHKQAHKEVVPYTPPTV